MLAEGGIRSIIGSQESNNMLNYTDHAGLKFPVDLCSALLISRQIAIGKAGPISALESMGPNPTCRCHFLNIGPSYK